MQLKIRSSSFVGEDRSKGRRKKVRKREKERERLRGIEREKTLGRIRGSRQV